MVEESLLTPEVRALIGQSSEPVRVRVTRRGTERAAEVYFGEPVTITAGPGEDVPGFAIAALEFDPEPASAGFPALMPNTILISNEWLFERPLRMDEELVAVRRLADVTERFGGQFGYSLNIRQETEFADPAGATIARTVTTMMQYDAKNARKGDSE